MQCDAIVLGAGPAGLGAALSLVRAGADVAVVDGAEHVGGMSMTRQVAGGAYDLGGHILFVHDADRESWLRELLADDLVWVDRPVVSLDNGSLTDGRYLDRREGGIGPPPPLLNGDGSAAELLYGAFGSELVDRTMRRYLEKVDGMALERITAARARKLLVEQYAPDGFWFPRHGCGQLMTAMARAIEAGGGRFHLDTRIESITATTSGHTTVHTRTRDGQTETMTSDRVLGAIPALAAARLIDPPIDATAVAHLPWRAAAIVVLSVATSHVTANPWIQIDRADVPFARLAEMKNWSDVLAPQDSTLLVCEVYCHADSDDPQWSRDDAGLADACASALVDPLGFVGRSTRITTVDVVRIPRAWPLVDVNAVPAVAEVVQQIATRPGFIGAQGGDVITAIAAGEEAARVALTGRA